jgi:hypothetical protein
MESWLNLIQIAILYLLDGRDKNGNFVNSGVYLLLAGSEFNGESSVAKIAVVKK